MITRIAIENFKGIRDRVEIELRPITLLFGANSAGKSTILHALHYAREIFERHNLSPDQTVTGGEFVDLGGFRNFVHGHDESLTINLGFEVNLGEYSNAWFDPLDAVGEVLQFERFSDGVIDSFGSFDSAEVVLSIAWSQLQQKAYVSSVAILNDGAEVGRIKAASDGRRVTLSFNANHPRLGSLESWAARDEVGLDDVREIFDTPEHSCLRHCIEYFDQLFENDSNGNHFLDGLTDALPTSGRGLPFVRREMTQRDANGEWFEDTQLARRVAADLVEGLSRLFLFPLEAVRESIRRFHYLGPLRETPSREYRPPQFPDPSRWASGLGAWDTLHTADPEFVDRVGEWLGGPENLNAGCRIEKRTYLELDCADEMVRLLL